MVTLDNHIVFENFNNSGRSRRRDDAILRETVQVHRRLHPGRRHRVLGGVSHASEVLKGNSLITSWNHFKFLKIRNDINRMLTKVLPTYSTVIGTIKSNMSCGGESSPSLTTRMRVTGVAQRESSRACGMKRRCCMFCR